MVDSSEKKWFIFREIFLFSYHSNELFWRLLYIGDLAFFDGLLVHKCRILETLVGK